MAALRAEAMLDSKTVFALNSVSYLSNSGTGGPKCIPHEPDIISLTLYSRLPVMGSADDGSNGESVDIASTKVIGLREGVDLSGFHPNDFVFREKIF